MVFEMSVFEITLFFVDDINWAFLAFIEKMFHVEAQLAKRKHDNATNQQHQDIYGCKAFNC